MRNPSPEAYIDPTEHRLPASLNAKIFHEQIVPEHFSDLEPSSDPTLTILMAQPGAGKTFILDSIARPTLSEKGQFANLDSDIFKTYHPQYAELMESNDTAMAACTGEDARLWSWQAYQYVRHGRLNSLTQEIVTNPPFLLDMICSFRDSGFAINLIALAVPEAVSRQGIISRYLHQVTENGWGRLTEPKKTTQSMSGMSQFVQKAYDENLLDDIQILKRSGEKVHYEPQGCSGEEVAQAITSIRQAPLSPEDAHQFRQTQNHLEESLGDEWAEELARIRKLAQPLLLTAGVEITTLTVTTQIHEPEPTQEFHTVHQDSIAS